MNWINTPCPKRDQSFKQHALERQTQLTKPQGSLGKLEEIAIRLADLQQRHQPSAMNISIAIFVADHGIAVEGVSAFPQEVTAQMITNFLQGGAAISVLAKQLEANLEIIDVGILNALPEQTGLIVQRAGAGTKNSLHEKAMTQAQLETALQAGYNAIERAIKNKTEIFIGGEMGIGNTTSATVLYCALLGLTAEEVTGAGTGLDKQGIAHKIKVVKSILEKHQACKNKTLEWLRCAGGFEIVALTGAYIHAAQMGLSVLVDGFISSVAALCAVRIMPEVNDYLFFSHVSAEQGHRKVLNKLQETQQQEALLALDLRLGEGSGAAIAVSLLQSACALHNNMSTFAEAAIATKNV